MKRVAVMAEVDRREAPGAAERALWAEVLCQVLRDLGSGCRADRVAAEEWVGSSPSAAFRETCALAEVDFLRAHARMREIIDAPVAARRTVAGMGYGPKGVVGGGPRRPVTAEFAGSVALDPS